MADSQDALRLFRISGSNAERVTRELEIIARGHVERSGHQFDSIATPSSDSPSMEGQPTLFTL